MHLPMQIGKLEAHKKGIKTNNKNAFSKASTNIFECMLPTYKGCQLS